MPFRNFFAIVLAAALTGTVLAKAVNSADRHEHRFAVTERVAAWDAYDQAP